jgi:hypothetical protein
MRAATEILCCGCVVVCDLFLVYMLGNCYVLAGGVKKELVFAGT